MKKKSKAPKKRPIKSKRMHVKKGILELTYKHLHLLIHLHLPLRSSPKSHLTILKITIKYTLLVCIIMIIIETITIIITLITSIKVS